MGEETIAVGLAEETEFTHPPAKRPPPDADYKVYWAWRKTPLPPRRASGALTLSMKDVSDVGRKSWTDRKPKRLEDSLNTFVAALVRAAGVLQQRRREREEHERRWKE